MANQDDLGLMLMPELHQRAVMQTPFTRMLPRPSRLLRTSIGTILEIGMIFDLGDRSLMK